MSFDLDTIYSLLPAIYRIRDSEQGYPLRALLSLVADQVAVLEEDLEQLYDDQFIETCAEWVVPYIGDLIGTRGVHGLTSSTFSQRTQVANTIAYRRRKGTSAVLEQLARDVTGWNTRIVEFFQLLTTTQYMNHIRPANVATPDLRQWEPLEMLSTPFETTPHTADVRRIANGRGRYNIPNIGIFLWRLKSYPLTSSPAFRVDSQRFMFSPLGTDTQLFSRPRTETSIGQMAEFSNVPMPLHRRILANYMSNYYGRDRSFSIMKEGAEIQADDIEICDLSDVPGDKWAHSPQKMCAIDPVLGRIAFRDDMSLKEICVSFHYGFCMDMGSGEYSRLTSFMRKPEECNAWQIVKVQSPKCMKGDPVPGAHSDIHSAFSTLSSCGIIEIVDSGTYSDIQAIDLTLDRIVEIRAADNESKCRPTLSLREDLEIIGGNNSGISLNGLIISGGKIRISGNMKLIRLNHCTLVPGLKLIMNGEPAEPGEPSLIIESEKAVVEIDSCIIGGIRAVNGTRMRITNSIIDATSEKSVAYSAPEDSSANGSDVFPGGILEKVENCTFIGKVRTSAIKLVSNSIFLADLEDGDAWEAPVWSDRRQEGCIRFSYLPSGSKVSRRYRCQPDMAEKMAEERLRKSKKQPSSKEIKAVKEAERIRVKPQLNSRRYTTPSYCQLGERCAIEIVKGAEDESEMGAFHDLYQPQKDMNLRIKLEEYLRFGLEAGIFYVN